MAKKLKNIISVVFSLVKFSLVKLVRWKEFTFSPVERFSPSTAVNIHKGGKMVLGNRVRCHTGTRLGVTPGAEMIIGDNTAFNYNCIVASRCRIKIGRNCTFGPNVVAFDHDHDFRNCELMNGDMFSSKEIIIGDNVWIGANALILKGSVIGDNSVIAGGTVVMGQVPSDSVCYNKKELITKKYK